MLLNEKQQKNCKLIVKFINRHPRTATHSPYWVKDLAHQESKNWMLNKVEIFHVQEMIDICNFNKLLLIHKTLSTSNDEFSLEDCKEITQRIEKQLKDLKDHLNSIQVKNEKIRENLGDDWLEIKH